MRYQESMIGRSPALARALEHLSQLAGIDRPVLILGERGTGKELAAQRLHYLSPRWDAPLVKVNCAAMAESLLESELFGHEPGAFTGATRTHRGRFERADGGTLFLDELGTMSLRLQEKLLRLVEYGEFERVGGQQVLQVDVRVIGATHADLRESAVRGEFRADLLDRLSFDVVHLPPLRERSGDVAELAQHFAMGMCAELGWDLFPGFSEGAMQALERHAWPGNVRELKNAVERSLHRWGEPGRPVEVVVIDPFVAPWAQAPGPTNEPDDDALAETGARAPSSTADFTARVAAFERRVLLDALAASGHNQRRAAAAMGLSYHQMRGLVRKYGLSRERRRVHDSPDRA